MRPVRALAPVARPARWLLAPALVAVSLLTFAGAAQAAEGFRFTEPSVEVSEGQSLARVTVERTDLPVSKVTVDYRLEAATAAEGPDFVGGAGRLVFDVGEQHAVVVVYLRDDDLAEEREHLVVQLLGRSSASTTVTIIDDDGPLAPTGRAAERAAAPATTSTPSAESATAVPAAAPRPEPARRRVVATRPATPAPRRVTVRQSPVTPFELRPAPGTATTSPPGSVDPAIAVLAGLLLARVAAEAWFRARTAAS